MLSQYSNKVVSIGDSHIASISRILPFVQMGPVLAYNALSHLIKLYERPQIHHHKGIILSFGEIDCRVHLQKQIELQEKSPEEIVDICVDRYGKGIEFCKGHGQIIIVWNVVPPAKGDWSYDPKFDEWKPYGAYEQRKLLANLFNAKLEIKCREIGVGFLDIRDEIMSGEDVDAGYFSDGIHLSAPKVKDFIEPKLVELLKDIL